MPPQPLIQGNTRVANLLTLVHLTFIMREAALTGALVYKKGGRIKKRKSVHPERKREKLGTAHDVRDMTDSSSTPHRDGVILINVRPQKD